MPDLPSPEVKALIEAIDTFGETNPRDLPDGLLDDLKGLGQSLRGYAGGELLSPGEREAKGKAEGSDTAVDYRQAAKGHDQPSPGQREYQEVAQKARDVAEQVSALSGNASGSV